MINSMSLTFSEFPSFELLLSLYETAWSGKSPMTIFGRDSVVDGAGVVVVVVVVVVLIHSGEIGWFSNLLQNIESFDPSLATTISSALTVI